MSCPISGYNFSQEEKEILKMRIRQVFKNAICLPLQDAKKIEFTYHFRKTKTGKIHLVHKDTNKSFCSFKIKTLGEPINLMSVDENDICIRCVQLYNTFRSNHK